MGPLLLLPLLLLPLLLSLLLPDEGGEWAKQADTRRGPLPR